MVPEYYSQIKLIHILAVTLSGTLFFIRGALVQTGRTQLAMRAPLRFLSYGIDTVLLTAGIALIIILPSAVFANGWLTAKLILVFAYIITGSLALKRARTASGKRWAFITALLVFAVIVSIALTGKLTIT